MFPDGIYLDLPEDPYHRDPALGSTNTKQLLYDPAEYWYRSHLNPLSPDDSETYSKTVGTAFHTMILDGLETFKSRYAVKPSGDGWLRTCDDIAEWLRERGVKPSRKKDDLIAQAVGIDPDVRIIDLHVSRLIERGVSFLRPDSYEAITQAAVAIARNKFLMNAISNGYREVSVFWTEMIDGIEVRRKARFDFLRWRAVIDLKSIAPRGTGSFPQECTRAIANYRYDIQAAAYMEARSRLPQFVRDGAVSVCSPDGELTPPGEELQRWLDTLANVEDYAYVLLFWGSNGSPLTWACKISPGSSILQCGHVDVTVAISRYVECMKRFGPNEPWATPQEIEELSGEDMPAWFATSTL